MTSGSKRKKALIVYNPTAGTAHYVDVCLGTLIHKLCTRLNLTPIVCATSPEFSHEDVVDLIEDDLELVIAAGGDGTIRLVLGAVAAAKSNIPVGLMPIGTGNQLARNLKIYEENLLNDPIDEAIAVILKGRTVPIDLGRMNGQYFCVAAGAGPLSDAIITPSRRDKQNLKMFAYVGSMITQLALPPVVFKVKTGKDNFTVSASGIFVTNVAELGVGTLSDSAELNDGLLDLCILTPAEFTDYLTTGFHFASGGLAGDAPYYIRKVDSVEIEVLPVESPMSDLQSIAHNIRAVLQGADGSPPVYKEVTAMIDGDAWGTTPMKVEVVPSAVRVLVP